MLPTSSIRHVNYNVVAINVPLVFHYYYIPENPIAIPSIAECASRQ